MYGVHLLWRFLLLQFTSPVRVRGGKLVGCRVQNPNFIWKSNYFGNQTKCETKLFSSNNLTLQGMGSTNFGVFFFFSSLHLWELEVENLSVVVCKTQLFCMLDIWFRLGREFKTMLGLRARRFVSTRSKLTNHPTITCNSASLSLHQFNGAAKNRIWKCISLIISIFH